MRLLILSVGRFGGGPERLVYEHYAARFRPLAPRLGFGALELVEIPAGRSEAEAFSSRQPQDSRSIALDPRGETLTSEAFAARLRALRAANAPALAFLIGGASGLPAELRARADLSLSLGALTYPHLLVRGMLAEQIYRAATILLDHPYHRG